MGLDDDIAILAAAPLFGFLDRDALRLLTFAAERRDLADGDLLFARGDPADGGFVVMAGTIRLEPRLAGAEPVRAGRSALIGQLALFVRGTRPTEARAEGSAGVMRITPMLMRRVLEEFPAAAQAVHDTLADDLADLVTDLDQVRELLEIIDGISSGDSSGGRL
ncbi:cyclic nucleotide-binding domain-containing protein [Methylobacterium radiotolerans]|uniref:cyclic nucleotide-binding domain-containing protein n=1 Tax=Methylobacterium TaxID=407 RepID=UPI0005E044C0|nr:MULTISPECIES: Crp/Fnr family transcriptional regulator [Methylobacterium]MBN6823541.1 Crp/Fnr family transcriptional regulator [Methylobacterium organophilum]OXE42788.1 Crp/Fnr family transcriptional regulator [Methylobacterium radiotolerans]GAN51560.1 cyclic nucleotide-binding protein [Methylobacterium sp. ME121]